MAIAIKLGDPQPYPVGDSYVTIRYLENITFLNGSVSFNYSNRTKTLESICVYNNSGTLIREINIETTLREYNRVLLDRIRIKGISGSDSQVYEFNYRLPALDYSPYTKGVDYWGYYNGQEGNTDLIPNQRVPLYNTGVIVDSVTIEVPITGYLRWQIHWLIHWRKSHILREEIQCFITVRIRYLMMHGCLNLLEEPVLMKL